MGHNEGFYCFAGHVIGNTNNSYFGQTFVLQDTIFYLSGTNSLARALEKLLGAIQHINESVAIDGRQITGVEPARSKGGGGFFRSAPIALADVLAFCHNLSDCSGFHLPAALIENMQGDSRDAFA